MNTIVTATDYADLLQFVDSSHKMCVNLNAPEILLVSWAIRQNRNSLFRLLPEKLDQDESVAKFEDITARLIESRWVVVNNRSC
jgi:hypothetical protein